MKRLALVVLAILAVCGTAKQAAAFCGFYVAKADTKLFNKASKVVLVRDEGKTVLTMASDYQGEPKEFALVVPVPTVLEKEQVHVASSGIVDHLDAYTAPRLVEYHDENPCMMTQRMSSAPMAAGVGMAESEGAAKRAQDLGVKIEAQYTVGEYDILILSAEQSSGLETWLNQEGYKIPEGATEVLGSYLKQGMKFFVAKVNLEEHSKLGFSFLRPLQIAFDSPKFMLPIRLGTVNANGPQDLFIFALTKKGRVESTNYRTVKIPEGSEIPTYVKDVFPEFYRAMFDTQVKEQNMKAVFLEYAWDMGWCDPCAAEPLSNSELRELGVFWLEQGGDPVPMNRRAPMFAPPSGAQNVFVTRLHVRYDQEHFPEDLQFQETSDRSNFQGRYVMRHPWTGSDSCSAADDYRKQLKVRQQTEIDTLARLTGWQKEEIRKKLNLPAGTPDPSPTGSNKDRWWKSIW